jgi:hypothetical protein
MRMGGSANGQAGGGSVRDGTPNYEGERGGEDRLCDTSQKERNDSDVGHLKGSRTTMMEGSRSTAVCLLEPSIGK